MRGLPLLVALVTAPVSASESVHVITADDWARPRSGDSLVQMPALRQTVREYLERRSEGGASGVTGGDTRIVIRHPRGEEGVLWAEELRGWLVALGIPSDDVAVSPESTRMDALELAVGSETNL